MLQVALHTWLFVCLSYICKHIYKSIFSILTIVQVEAQKTESGRFCSLHVNATHSISQFFHMWQVLVFQFLSSRFQAFKLLPQRCHMLSEYWQLVGVYKFDADFRAEAFEAVKWWFSLGSKDLFFKSETCVEKCVLYKKLICLQITNVIGYNFFAGISAKVVMCRRLWL